MIGLLFICLIMAGISNSPYSCHIPIPGNAEHGHHLLADICVYAWDRPLNIPGHSSQNSNPDIEGCSSSNHTPFSCCIDHGVCPTNTAIIAAISSRPHTPDPTATIPLCLHPDIFWTADGYSISLSMRKVILFGPPIYLRNSSFLC
jgi:hypothetical protein